MLCFASISILGTAAYLYITSTGKFTVISLNRFTVLDVLTNGPSRVTFLQAFVPAIKVDSNNKIQSFFSMSWGLIDGLAIRVVYKSAQQKK
jgi:hypothetical protein